MALVWTSALAVGVEEIDEQHRELFRRADLLLAAVLAGDRAAEVGRLVAFLQAYAKVHFAAEEQLMQASGYSQLAEHRGEHRWFEEELARLAAELAVAGPTAQLAYALDRHLAGWLRNHVCLTDTALGRYLARTGRSPRAAVK
jgi:hemerythrin